MLQTKTERKVSHLQSFTENLARALMPLRGMPPHPRLPLCRHAWGMPHFVYDCSTDLRYHINNLTLNQQTVSHSTVSVWRTRWVLRAQTPHTVITEVVFIIRQLGVTYPEEDTFLKGIKFVYRLIKWSHLQEPLWLLVFMCAVFSRCCMLTNSTRNLQLASMCC